MITLIHNHRGLYMMYEIICFTVLVQWDASIINLTRSLFYVFIVALKGDFKLNSAHSANFKYSRSCKKACAAPTHSY